MMHLLALCRVALLALFALWVGVCAAEPLVLSGPTMGTVYHVKIVDAAAVDEASLRADIEMALADIDARLSTYRGDSEISRFNRAPAGQWFAVSPATAEVVERALGFCRATGGALDITVGPLVQLWHFGPSTLADAKTAAHPEPPTDTQIRAVRELVGYEKLDVRRDPPALRKQVAGLQIDLSSVGEGHAIDRLVEVLAAHRVDRFLIEIGGEVRAQGAGPQGVPWRVAIQRPTSQRPQLQTAVSLVDAALATSGDYRRFFESAGRRYSHIIDPATGRPVDHALASVTVAAADALSADARSTALLVLGPERGYDWAVEHDVAALFIARAGQEFTTKETPAWRERFATAASSSTAAPQTRSP